MPFNAATRLLSTYNRIALAYAGHQIRAIIVDLGSGGSHFGMVCNSLGLNERQRQSF